MAAEQLEDGFTRIANHILEMLLQAPIGGRELRVVLAVIRESYGWNRKDCRLTLLQIGQMTGLAREHVCEVVKRLVGLNILKVDTSTNPRTYRFNKYSGTWNVVFPKREHGSRNGNTVTVPKMVTQVFPKREHDVPKMVTPNIHISTKDSTKDMIKDSTRSLERTRSPVQQLFDIYFEEYQKAHGRKPDVIGGKDGAAFKRLLNNHTSEELQQWLVWYVNSDEPFYVRVGWNIGTFSSQINGIIEQYNGGGNGTRGSTGTVRSKEEEARVADLERKFEDVGKPARAVP
jgi:phage replication O-like protein O